MCEPPRARALTFGVGCLAHVGQHEVFEADLLDGPGRVVDRRIALHEEGALSFGVGRFDDVLIGREAGGVAARPDEPVVGGQELLDVSGDPHSGRGQQDQVVAHPFQVADQVR